ncbi:MAG: hypothetical protein KAT58_09490 [candidate division Zixibacteria bacterium]|nr:hypothetical protein [candidate division Zixibacteria bacterium]
MPTTNLTARIDSLLSGKRFYLILALILLCGIVPRILYLNADPPVGITRSQDFSTDPFAYVMFAKNKIAVGDANPYNDERWILYERSTQTVAGLVVYSIFGTGRAAGNLVGVILNLLAVLLVALGIKNFGSRRGAIFFTLLACFNYTLIHFSRAPFLEASQNFWLCAAFYLFSRGKDRSYFYLLAGIAAAAAALFGKFIALFAVSLYLAVWLIRYFLQPDQRKQIIGNAGFFYGGYLVVALFWLFFSYLPHTEEVTRYLSEQGVGLYGAPRALESVKMFFWQLGSLLWQRDFIVKLPLITTLGTISGAAVIYSLLKRRTSRSRNQKINIGWVILLFWVAFGLTALFPFNYRPLRYQTTLMFPLMALAGVLLGSFLTAATTRQPGGGKSKKAITPWHLGIGWAVWFFPFLCAIVMALRSMGADVANKSQVLAQVQQQMQEGMLLFTLIFLGVGFGLAYLVKLVVRFRRSLLPVGRYLALVLIVGYLIVQLYDYGSWARTRQYTLITADRDLGAVLNEKAVISGSYACALTQENRLRFIHHMFGVAYLDREFFSRFPITHLVVDAGNESEARKNYPRVMSQAHLLATYHIRGWPVKLFRIAGTTGNEEAGRYQLSDFEKARYWVDQQNNDSARYYFGRYLEADIPNYSVDLALGTKYAGEEDYPKALYHLGKVHRFAPRDFLNSLYMGYTYLNAVGKIHNPTYFDSALLYLEFAHLLVPTDKKLAETVEQLKERK